jgi:hypothetical protein
MKGFGAFSLTVSSLYSLDEFIPSTECYGIGEAVDRRW